MRKVKLDAVFLDLHGAMVVEGQGDGEIEILQRVREIIPSDCKLVVALDWHANLALPAFKLADAISIYRTYPHVDTFETGQRCYSLLLKLLHRPMQKSQRMIPQLIPFPAQYDKIEPARSLCMQVKELSEAKGVQSLDFAPGFPLSDGPTCHPSIVGQGQDQEAVNAAVLELQKSVMAAETLWIGNMLGPEEAIQKALQISQAIPDKPVVLADVQDNSGGGASSDTVGVLKQLAKANVDSVVAVLWDEQSAFSAHSAGIGTTLKLSLGCKASSFESPQDGDFEVLNLTDGTFTITGDMWKGSQVSMGPTALLRVKGSNNVRVIVSSNKFQVEDTEVFRHIGVDPEKEKLLILKSTVQFRNAFTPISSDVLLVESPGENICNLDKTPFKNLSNSVRIRPLSKL